MKPTLLTFLALALTCVPPAFANETLAVLPDSAADLGMAGGRYANIDDPAAVRSNPANILGIDTPTAEINASWWYGDISFTNLAGQTEKMSDPSKFLGSAYFVEPISPGVTAWGLGISTPYGISSEWPQNGILKYLIPYQSDLLTVDLTPVFTFKVANGLSIGIGMELMYSDLQLKQLYPYSAVLGVPVPDGVFDFNGNGFGVGGFMGVNWEPVKGQRLALVGRLPLDTHYAGDFSASNMPGALKAAGYSSATTFDSNFRYPGSLAAGYGCDITDKLTLGLDAMWSGNSSQQDLPLLIGQDQTLLGKQGVVLNWKDSWEGGLGLRYKLDQNWTLRAGYIYAAASQPDQTFNPAVASNERSLITLGAGWKGQTNSVDLTLAYVAYPNRDVTDNVEPGFDGTYSIRWLVVSMSFTHRF